MLMKWLDGNVIFLWKFLSMFLWSVLMCAFMSCWRGRKVTTGWLLTPPPPLRGHGRNAEPQQWETLSAWKEVGKLWEGVGRGAGGVYLSHGNWFAGVEVGSFEKTSFSLTPSHLSVWKAAGRKGRRIERGREGASEGVLLQRHFHTKAGESEWVCLKAQSDASLKWRIHFLHPAK